jgi:hypothetical protein
MKPEKPSVRAKQRSDKFDLEYKSPLFQGGDLYSKSVSEFFEL